MSGCHLREARTRHRTHLNIATDLTQGEAERRALALAAAFGPDRPTVCLNVVLADRQPQTRAGSRSRRIRFVEAFEDAHELIALNTHACVGNPEFDPAVDRASTRLDPPARRAELDGVGQQVSQDLPNSAGICLHENCTLGRLRHTERESNPLRVWARPLHCLA